MASYTPEFWRSWAVEHRVPLEPCTEAAVQAMQARLNCPPLPPSYRHFLLTVGCPAVPVHFELEQLLPLDKVQWFRDEHDDWIRHYEDNDADNDKEWEGWKISDLRKTLLVTDVNDSLFLLNPNKVDAETGEWSAWLFANWVPGAQVHASFGELLTESFQEMEQFLAEQREAEEEADGTAGEDEGRVEAAA